MSQAVEVLLSISTNDDKRPAESPSVQALQSETLAGVVRRRIKALAKAKVTTHEADLLEELATETRRAETAWRDHWIDGSTSKPLAKARDAATVGRRDLFSALRTFASDDAATQAALDDIGGVEDDADLLQDLSRLVALAKKHEGDLEGTDVDGARRGQIESAAEAFRKIRPSGVETASSDAEASEGAEALAARTEVGQGLLRARNRAYWALVNVDRAVRDKGRHAFRHDPKALGEFASLTNHRAAGKRKKKAEGEGATGKEGGEKK